MLRTLLVTTTCVLLVFGNLLLRQALQRSGVLRWDAAQLAAALLHWRALLGVAVLLAAGGVWMAMLSRGQVSYSYPLLAFSALPMVMLSWWFLGETLTLEKVIGGLLMLIGAIIVIRGGQP